MMKNEEKTKNFFKTQAKRKKTKNTGEKTRRKKTGKEDPKVFIRTVKRNRNEIETQKNSDFEHPTKKNKKKEKRK